MFGVGKATPPICVRGAPIIMRLAHILSRTEVKMAEVHARRFGQSGSLVASTAVLAAASIAGKIVGAIYRVPLTNVLGAEGMGLYQTFFPVYALFVTLTSGALPTITARAFAAAKARGEDGANVYAAARRMSFALAAAGMALFAAAIFPVAKLQSAGEFAIGYALLLPAVGAVALSALYRGIFLADGGSSVCALTQTAEQAIKLIFGLACAYFAARRGVEYAVYGALAAVTISEFAGALTLRTAFRRRYKFLGARVDKTLSKEMFAAMLPLIASALVLPLCAFVDSFAIVGLLRLDGVVEDVARAQYGLLTGAVGTLVNMPIVVAFSASAAALPKFTSEYVRGGANAAHAKTSAAVGWGVMFAVPCAIAFAIFPRELLAVLYPTLSGAELAVAARLLQWQAAGIVPVVVMQLLCSSLQAMDGGGKVMRIMLVAAIVKQALQAVLIPRVGVVGAPVAQCAMYFVAATAAAFVYRKRTGSAFIARKTFAKTALAGVIMVIAEKAVTLADISPWAKLAAAAVTAIAAYSGVLLAVGALKPRFRRENNTNEETRRHCRDARHIDD